MPAAEKLELSEEQREQLERWTKNPPKPHLRRRAWAMLLISEGQPVYQVAQDRRIRAHRTTVAEWLARYRASGSAGLRQRPGQGRKPAFFPSDEKRGAGAA